MLRRALFPLYLMSIYTFYYVDLMVVLSLLLFWLYAGYKYGFMIDFSYGSHHVFISK